MDEEDDMFLMIKGELCRYAPWSGGRVRTKRMEQGSKKRYENVRQEASLFRGGRGFPEDVNLGGKKRDLAGKKREESGEKGDHPEELQRNPNPTVRHPGGRRRTLERRSRRKYVRIGKGRGRRPQKRGL